MSIPLTTTYLGLELPSPIVVGAATPLSSDLRQLEQLEQVIVKVDQVEMVYLQL